MTPRGAAVLSILALTALASAGCSSAPPAAPTTAPTAASSTGPAPGGATTTATPDSGPTPPENGLVLGAWVQPETYTETGREQALTTFESILGRPLGMVQDFHTWDDEFPSEFDLHIVDSGASLLLSWAGTDTRQIVTGQYDDMIRQRAEALKKLDKPVLLRWRWEMERPNLAAEVGSPQDYIAAWKHIRAIFDTVDVPNVGWVWCPLAGGFDSAGRAPEYFPGDDQVDWICADVYAPDPSVPFAEVAASFLTWAAEHPQPIIFAEVGTQRAGTDERAGWLSDAATVMSRNPQVKSFVYFDSDIAREGRTRRWSLRGFPKDLEAMRDIAENPAFQGRLGAD